MLLNHRLSGASSYQTMTCGDVIQFLKQISLATARKKIDHPATQRTDLGSEFLGGFFKHEKDVD